MFEDGKCNTIVVGIEQKMRFFFQFLIPSLWTDNALIIYILQIKCKRKEKQIIEGKQHWIPPLEESLKLNTNEAWKGLNESKCGGVLRRPTGTWCMGFSTKFHSIIPLTIELFSIREGINLARDFGIEKLEMETDALALRAMMEIIDQKSHLQLAPFLTEVASLLRRN